MVAGATGFVGRRVVRDLLAAGHDVVALVRTPANAGDLTAAGVQLVTGDMLRPESFRSVVAEVDAVVNTAQYPVAGRFTSAKAEKVRFADHLLNDTLATACIADGKRLVYTSGVFNYGDRGQELITEATPFNPSPIGAGHAAEVTALRRLHRDGGLDVVVISPGFVVGPGGLFKTSFYDQVQKKRLRVIGPGANYWSCVQVDDLAAAFVIALQHAPAGAEYNVVDDEPLTLRALVDEITSAMGRKSVGNIPPWLMGLIIGRPLVESLIASFRVSNQRLRTELGWSPIFRTVAAALPSTLAALDSRDRLTR